MHFLWRPSNSPVTSANPNRPNIGLELGGDEPALGAAAPGTIKLFETGGSGADAGSQESSTRRLLATFHGTFHRIPTGPAARRVTFEIELAGVTQPEHSGNVSGFDPECMVGVDCLILTFLNREFRVLFPFFVDTRSEGRFLEIVAVAEIEGRSAVESQVLNLRIRRTHEVETTTRSPSGSGYLRYSGRVIGNIILHHEDYLVQAGVWNAGTTPPSSLDVQLIPVYAGGPHPIPFASYTSGSMRVILLTQLLSALTPTDQELTSSLTDSRITRPTSAALRTRIANRIRQEIAAIFTDAGFAGAQAFWSDSPTVATEMAGFNRDFNQTTSDCFARSGRPPMQVPFWTFFVGYSSSPASGAVAVAETAVYDNTTNTYRTSSKEYLLPCRSPIGSGNKAVRRPILFKSDYFQEKLLEPVLPPRPRRGAARPFDYNQTIDAMGSKVAITIAHEIAHSLGLMHDVLILNSGPYREDRASPLMSIMCSSVDNDSFGVQSRFSNQAKVIWANAFGVTPTWTTTYLQNKTWGTDWRTVDWGDRMHRLFERNQESGMGRPSVSSEGTPPFAGAGSNVQRGTYVAP